MKKLILSLSIIGAITIGTGAIAFAAEEDSPVTNSVGAEVSETDNSNIDQDYNINEDNNYSGWRNQNCPYYGEGYQGQGQKSEEENRYGFNSESRGRGTCRRSGSMMGFRY
ncbi:hypothetical protein PMY56_04850 [Clostridium tertium]|uniref:hypothetical protein n=1 Tax=Clostridium tertium TaxID=1559 RepID=UPI001AE8FAD4|nr:hypothetical protein [Clostridium tertium]MBP1868852.1 hypothetical protein [Clostridium tertium]MDB1920931.1 hypothetical protein [Clostridium tertium]MDB1925462.1 hypothetical protein [Clostridium tertium]MDB1928544.1 hypothetical protein [Clostridium tertium]